MINHFIGAPIKSQETLYIYNVYYTGNENIKNTETEKIVQTIIFNLLKDYLM